MSVTKKPAKRYHCARCGKRLPKGVWIYSSHTGNRYCADPKACDERAQRRGKRG